VLAKAWLLDFRSTNTDALPDTNIGQGADC
jgi:hypothetical protein